MSGQIGGGHYNLRFSASDFTIDRTADDERGEHQDVERQSISVAFTRVMVSGAVHTTRTLLRAGLYLLPGQQIEVGQGSAVLIRERENRGLRLTAYPERQDGPSPLEILSEKNRFSVTSAIEDTAFTQTTTIRKENHALTATLRFKSRGAEDVSALGVEIGPRGVILDVEGRHENPAEGLAQIPRPRRDAHPGAAQQAPAEGQQAPATHGRFVQRILSYVDEQGGFLDFGGIAMRRSRTRDELVVFVLSEERGEQPPVEFRRGIGTWALKIRTGGSTSLMIERTGDGVTTATYQKAGRERQLTLSGSVGRELLNVIVGDGPPGGDQFDHAAQLDITNNGFRIRLHEA